MDDHLPEGELTDLKVLRVLSEATYTEMEEWKIRTSVREGHAEYQLDAGGEPGWPNWYVAQGSSAWRVEFELGWYEQRGEAPSLAELSKLIEAMNAAHDALELNLVLGGLLETT